MRSAIIILTVVVAVATEAPYHLPRPAPQAPPFGYPSGPAQPSLPLPSFPSVPLPQLPQPRPSPKPLAPLPLPVPVPPSQGYNYQPPSFGPAFIHPAPQPIPVYRPPAPVQLPAPLPQPLLPTYPQPQPIPINYLQQQQHPNPQPSYGLPLPRQLPQPQPQPQPLPNFYNPPQTPLPITPLSVPTFPQPQSYVYQQPISQPQFIAPLPLQSQPLTNNAVSSYQADSNQYATQAQTHAEALDQAVVSRVQNIIRDSEHTSAKNAGYLSLVSGVSLESAKPSIEISSFVHNSPQNNAGLIDVRSASSAAQSLSSANAGISSSYDVPTISSSQSSDSHSGFEFLPNKKPGISYGVPN